MPGPFPGMDPHLEDPTLWPGVHAGLIAALEAALNEVLPPEDAADIGERVYLLEARRDVYPDLAVARFARLSRFLGQRGSIPGRGSRGGARPGRGSMGSPRVATRGEGGYIEIRAVREDPARRDRHRGVEPLRTSAGQPRASALRGEASGASAKRHPLAGDRSAAGQERMSRRRSTISWTAACWTTSCACTAVGKTKSSSTGLLASASGFRGFKCRSRAPSRTSSSTFSRCWSGATTRVATRLKIGYRA